MSHHSSNHFPSSPGSPPQTPAHQPGSASSPSEDTSSSFVDDRCLNVPTQQAQTSPVEKGHLITSADLRWHDWQSATAIQPAASAGPVPRQKWPALFSGDIIVKDDVTASVSSCPTMSDGSAFIDPGQTACWSGHELADHPIHPRGVAGGH